MRIVLAVLLLVIAVPTAQAQIAPAPPSAPAPLQTVQLPSMTVESASAEDAAVAVSPAQFGVELDQAAARQERSRSLWFVLGALVAVAVVLAFTL